MWKNSVEGTLSRLRLMSDIIHQPGTRPTHYGGPAAVIRSAELALRQKYDELIKDFAARKCLHGLMKNPLSHSSEEFSF